MTGARNTCFVATLATAFAALSSLNAHGQALSKNTINSAGASYSAGTFTLPELDSPKDSYVLLINPKDGSEGLKFALAPGVTGIRLSLKALPEGAWEWSYKLARENSEKLTLLTSPSLQLSPGEVPQTGIVAIAWKPVAHADSYSVSGLAITPAPDGLNPKETKIEASCDARVCTQKSGIVVSGLDAKPGAEITWRVSAVDEDGVVLAKSQDAHISISRTGVQGAKLMGFSVQRSDALSKLTASQPALLSYQSSSAEGTSRQSAYQGQFAIIYDSPNEWNGFFQRSSLEARLTSTGDEKEKDTLLFRVGAYKSIFENPSSAEFTEWVTNLKYETERKKGTKKGLVEVGFTPIYGYLGRYVGGRRTSENLGVDGNFLRPPSLQVAPTIGIGAELGKTFEVGESEEKKDSILRLRTSARLDVEFGVLASILGTRNVSGFVEATYWRLPREDARKNYRFGSSGISFGLTDYVSFDVGYGAGRQAPLFKFERAATVGLGLKF
jgi:hypothetical protein